MSKLRLLAVCLLATFIMSGLVTPIGLLTASAAARYGVEITLVASQFSFFIGGVFLGYVVSFFVFDYLKMKTIIVTCYVITVICILHIHYVPDYFLLPYLLVSIGMCASIVTCAGGTLIARVWQGKKRQSVLVAQDAMFNGGGVLFAYIATFSISNDFAWSATYMVVAGVSLLVVILALLSTFDSGEQEQMKENIVEIRTEWNAGFILIGISLLLFLLAKISIFIWAPQFVEQKFTVSSEQSGQFMSNIFMSAFIGSILGAYVVSRLNVKYLLYALVILAIVASWLFSESNSFKTMLLLGFIFGLSISATYNSYVAFGLTFVSVPTHKHIAYLLLVGGLGSALAPVMSSKIVAMTGEVGTAMIMCTLLFVLGLLFLITGHIANILKTGRVLEMRCRA